MPRRTSGEPYRRYRRCSVLAQAREIARHPLAPSEPQVPAGVSPPLARLPRRNSILTLEGRLATDRAKTLHVACTSCASSHRVDGSPHARRDRSNGRRPYADARAGSHDGPKAWQHVVREGQGGLSGVEPTVTPK